MYQTDDQATQESRVGVDNSQMEIPDTTPVPTPVSRQHLRDWCRFHLGPARHRLEPVALAAWTQPDRPGRDADLGRMAAVLRGEDLLVDLGRDQFLLVLPRTARAGAEAVLARLRKALGPARVGATIWNPTRLPDRDAADLQPAIRRAQEAAPGGVDRRAPGAEDGRVVWSILEPSRSAFLGEAGEW
jgi:hypothetical protein